MSELVIHTKPDGSKWATIPFTQYLMPHGDTRKETIDRPIEIGELARRVRDRGGRFTVEMLRTGQVSLACEFEDDDISIRVCENGPAVLVAVDEMIAEAAKMIFSCKICGAKPDQPCDAGLHG